MKRFKHLRNPFLIAVIVGLAAWFSPTLTSVAPGTGIDVSTSGGVATVSLTDAAVSDFGDGSDGPVTVSTTITLSRNMYYTTLIVASGGIINTANWAIYGSVRVYVQSGGTIQNNGGNASGQSAGVGPSGGFFPAAANGVVGGGGVGFDGTSVTNALGGAGGAGGSGGSGAGGNGGTVTAGNSNLYHLIAWQEFAQGLVNGSALSLRAGASGGSGAGDGFGHGGGSGAGGPWLGIKAAIITVDSGGTIQANGGNGGSPDVNTDGVGGGGGGGVVSLLYRTYTNNGTVRALGGSKGTLGVGGVDGSVGRVIQRPLP